MKTYLILPLMAAALVGCNSKNASTETVETPEAEAAELNTLAVEGQWRLTDYPGENEINFIPEDADYILTFNEEDGTFGLTTDCNILGGQYKVNGDSITFDNIASTKMLCPNEQVERDMTTILPMISTYVITPDSTLILRADARIMAQFKYVAE